MYFIFVYFIFEWPHHLQSQSNIYSVGEDRSKQDKFVFKMILIWRTWSQLEANRPVVGRRLAETGIWRECGCYDYFWALLTSRPRGGQPVTNPWLPLRMLHCRTTPRLTSPSPSASPRIVTKA